MNCRNLASIVLLWTAVIAGGFSCGGKDTAYKSPESFIVDPATGEYYVSNVNGTPIKVDGNGYIVKLDKDLKPVNEQFINSDTGGVDLSAPKGMAIVDDVLYVTDITSVKGYDKSTGENVLDLDLKDKEAKFLNDICADKDGNLYVSDMSSSIIYKINTRNDSVTIFAGKGNAPEEPNGLVIDPATGNLVVVTWKGLIKEIDMDGEVTDFIDKEFNALDGVDFDDAGNLYVANYQEGKIIKITPDKKVSTIKEDLKDPADISVDRKNNRLLIPEMGGDKITTLDLDK